MFKTWPNTFRKLQQKADGSLRARWNSYIYLWPGKVTGSVWWNTRLHSRRMGENRSLSWLWVNVLLKKLLWHNSALLFTTACPPPPEIANGRHNQTTNPTHRVPVGTVFEYSCVDNYFPVGEFSDNLKTECLEGGTYSRQSTSLANCALISLSL